MSRKKRIDSSAAEAELIGKKMPEPPPHVNMRDGDRPFWQSVVRARDFTSWTEHDLEIAASLARCKADIERLQGEIDIEGDTLKNDRGTMVVNPKHTLLETLSRRAVALSRMLHVHAEATVGESRHQKKRSQKQQTALTDKRGTLDDDDGLIPGLVQ